MNIFCQFLGPFLYRGSTVLNFIYLLIVQKVGGPGPPPPPKPLPLALHGPCPSLAQAILVVIDTTAAPVLYIVGQ